MHWLIDKFKKLKPEEQELVVDELLLGYSAGPEIELSLMAEFTDEARKRMETFGKMQGISSGFPSVDELTKGFVGGELTIVAGKTSYGKTTLALNITCKVAQQNKPVLFVTMEMTKPEITTRAMVIADEAYDQIAAQVVFQKNDELNWKSVDNLIEEAVREMNVELVVIDHLHYFTRELDNVAEDLGRITKEFKKNAIRHNLPIILVSHVRKTDKKRQADIEDLRGSSYIAQDADIVLMVGRDLDNNDMHIRIEKNRNRGFDYKNNIAILKTTNGIKLRNKLSIEQ